MNNDTESSFDIRCSTSCTRSGVMVLILASIATSMLFSYKDLKPFIALSKYVSVRIILVDKIKDLEEDQCWKDLISENSKETTEEVLFTELINQRCDMQNARIISRSQDSQPENTNNTKGKNSVKDRGDTETKNYTSEKKLLPAPIMNLKITRGLYGVNEIAKNLYLLFDDKFLILAPFHEI